MIKLIDILNEIKVVPGRRKIWDFTEHIPNFDFKKIKVGDKIDFSGNDPDDIDEVVKINLNNQTITLHSNNPEVLNSINNEGGKYEIPVNLLYDINNDNKPPEQQNEIKVVKPPRVWDFNKYIPNFDPNNIRIGDKLIIPSDDKYFSRFEGEGNYMYKVTGPINNYDEMDVFDLLLKEPDSIYIRSLIIINQDNKNV